MVSRISAMTLATARLVLTVVTIDQETRNEGIHRDQVTAPPVWRWGRVLNSRRWVRRRCPVEMFRAASINRARQDLVRNGEVHFAPRNKPLFVLGDDLAGVVTQVRADVANFTIGDEAYSLTATRPGASAPSLRRIAIDADHVVLKLQPPLSFEEAAAVQLVVLAAWQALATRPRSSAGQKVAPTLVPVASVPPSSRWPNTSASMSLILDRPCRGRRQGPALGADEVIDQHDHLTSPTFLSGDDVVLDSLVPAQPGEVVHRGQARATRDQCRRPRPTRPSLPSSSSSSPSRSSPS